MYVCIYICNPAHRVSRPRGTGSVGDSVGEGTLTDSCASPSGGAGKGGGGPEARNQTGGSSIHTVACSGKHGGWSRRPSASAAACPGAHGCRGVCKRCVSKRLDHTLAYTIPY